MVYFLLKMLALAKVIQENDRYNPLGLYSHG